MDTQIKDYIVLRPLRQSDIDTLFALTSNPEVARYMRFQTHTDRSQAEQLYQEYTKEGNYGYLVTLPDGTAVGAAALKEGQDISIFSFPEYWNRGYSTQVVRELFKEAKSHGILYLKAYVVDENVGSRKILEKCGFTVEETFETTEKGSVLYIYSCRLDS